MILFGKWINLRDEVLHFLVALNLVIILSLRTDMKTALIFSGFILGVRELYDLSKIRNDKIVDGITDTISNLLGMALGYLISPIWILLSLPLLIAYLYQYQFVYSPFRKYRLNKFTKRLYKQEHSMFPIDEYGGCEYWDYVGIVDNPKALLNSWSAQKMNIAFQNYRRNKKKKKNEKETIVEWQNYSDGK